MVSVSSLAYLANDASRCRVFCLRRSRMDVALFQEVNNPETLSTVFKSFKNYLTGCLALAKAPPAKWLIFWYPFSTVPAIQVTSYYRGRSVT